MSQKHKTTFCILVSMAIASVVFLTGCSSITSEAEANKRLTEHFSNASKWEFLGSDPFEDAFVMDEFLSRSDIEIANMPYADQSTLSVQNRPLIGYWVLTLNYFKKDEYKFPRQLLLSKYVTSCNGTRLQALKSTWMGDIESPEIRIEDGKFENLFNSAWRNGVPSQPLMEKDDSQFREWLIKAEQRLCDQLAKSDTREWKTASYPQNIYIGESYRKILFSDNQQPVNASKPNKVTPEDDSPLIDLSASNNTSLSGTTQSYESRTSPEVSDIDSNPNNEDNGLNSALGDVETLNHNPVPSTMRDTHWHIVVASRETLEEAVALAESYKHQYPSEVYSTPNGWYAITIGHYPKDEAEKIKLTAIKKGDIGSDSWTSTGKATGKEWGGKVYP
jgi:hypothetical protein